MSQNREKVRFSRTAWDTEMLGRGEMCNKSFKNEESA